MGGSSAPNVMTPNKAQGQFTNFNDARNSKQVQDLLAGVGSGKISIQDALSQANSLGNRAGDPNALVPQMQAGALSNAAHDQLPNLPGLGEVTHGLENQLANNNMTDPTKNGQDMPYSSAALDALSTDPIAGSELAKYFVSKDPTLKGLFGDGGLQSQAESQYTGATKDLASDREALLGRDQSYGLTSQDLAAYGQTSDNIARMFGAQQNSLSQAMADRGLGAAPSGIAAQGFSNLMGNQNEQLAQAQMQIAQNRVNSAMQLAQSRANLDLNRQGQAGQLATNLGGLGQTAISNQFGRQLAGSENNYNQRAGAAGMALQNNVANQNQSNIQWAQDQSSGFNPVSFLGNVGSSFAGGAAGTAGSNLVGGKKVSIV